MTRILVPNERQAEDIRRQIAEGATGDEGIESLPVVCFQIEDCAAHRCEKHTEAPVLNTACYFDNFSECGACAYEAGGESMRLHNRIRKLFRL